MASALPKARADDKERQLDHLTGARCLAALWINCGHFVPHERPYHPYLNGAVFRLNVPVCFFIVMSGFVTQWAYGALELKCIADYLKFLLRRIGKVLPSFWLAMLAGSVVLKMQEYKPIDNPWYVASCFFMIEQWVSWCPNGPSWFVFALIPAWLMYPITRYVIQIVETAHGAVGLVMLALAWWFVFFLPGFVVFVYQGYYLDIGEHFAWSFSPPSQFGDFGVGCAMAALARRLLKDDKAAEAETFLPQLGQESAADQETLQERRGRLAGHVADASMVSTLAAVLLVPEYPKAHRLNRIGWEPLFDHALTPFIAAFLCASAVALGQGLSVRLLSHRALVALGFCSFEAYIFQRPLHDFYIMIFDPDSYVAFVVFLVILWSFAMLYATYVQPVFDNLLRSLSRCLFEPSGDTSPITPGAFGAPSAPQPTREPETKQGAAAGCYAPVGAAD